MVVVVSVGAAVMLSGCGKSESRREYEKAMREADADVQKMNAGMAKEDKQRAESERKFKQEEAARQAAIKKQEDDRNKEERASNEKAAKEDIQRLAALVVEPPVSISGKLRGFGMTTSYRGENLDPLQKLYKAKDWNGVIKAVGCGPDKRPWFTPTLPGPEATGFALQELQGKDFKLLAKTTQPLPFKKISVPESISHRVGGIGHALFFVAIPNRFNRPEDEPFRYDASWDEHPDGNGYLHEWNTYTAEIFLFFGEQPISPYPDGVLQDKLDKLQRDYEDKARKAVQKKELGESTQSQLDQEIVRLRATVRSSLAALVNQY